MGEKRRLKRKNKAKPRKSGITKKNKLIWIIVIVVSIILICFVLFLEFLNYFILI